MIVSEFIEWLKTQDQGATVKIIAVERGEWGDTFSRCDFDVNQHVDYSDLRGYKPANGTPYENMRSLVIGGE